MDGMMSYQTPTGGEVYIQMKVDIMTDGPYNPGVNFFQTVHAGVPEGMVVQGAPTGLPVDRGFDTSRMLSWPGKDSASDTVSNGEGSEKESVSRRKPKRNNAANRATTIAPSDALSQISNKSENYTSQTARRKKPSRSRLKPAPQLGETSSTPTDNDFTTDHNTTFRSDDHSEPQTQVESSSKAQLPGAVAVLPQQREVAPPRRLSDNAFKERPPLVTPQVSANEVMINTFDDGRRLSIAENSNGNGTPRILRATEETITTTQLRFKQMRASVSRPVPAHFPYAVKSTSSTQTPKQRVSFDHQELIRTETWKTRNGTDTYPAERQKDQDFHRNQQFPLQQMLEEPKKVAAQTPVSSKNIARVPQTTQEPIPASRGTIPVPAPRANRGFETNIDDVISFSPASTLVPAPRINPGFETIIDDPGMCEAEIQADLIQPDPEPESKPEWYGHETLIDDPARPETPPRRTVATVSTETQVEADFYPEYSVKSVSERSSQPPYKVPSTISEQSDTSQRTEPYALSETSHKTELSNRYVEGMTRPPSTMAAFFAPSVTFPPDVLRSTEDRNYEPKQNEPDTNFRLSLTSETPYSKTYETKAPNSGKFYTTAPFSSLLDTTAPHSTGSTVPYSKHEPNDYNRSESASSLSSVGIPLSGSTLQEKNGDKEHTSGSKDSYKNRYGPSGSTRNDLLASTRHEVADSTRFDSSYSTNYDPPVSKNKSPPSNQTQKIMSTESAASYRHDASRSLMNSSLSDHSIHEFSTPQQKYLDKILPLDLNSASKLSWNQQHTADTPKSQVAAAENVKVQNPPTVMLKSATETTNYLHPSLPDEERSNHNSSHSTIELNTTKESDNDQNAEEGSEEPTTFFEEVITTTTRPVNQFDGASTYAEYYLKQRKTMPASAIFDMYTKPSSKSPSPNPLTDQHTKDLNSSYEDYSHENMRNAVSSAANAIHSTTDQLHQNETQNKGGGNQVSQALAKSNQQTRNELKHPSSRNSIDSERSSVSDAMKRRPGGAPFSSRLVGSDLGEEDLSDYMQGRLSPLGHGMGSYADSTLSRDSVISETSTRNDRSHPLYDAVAQRTPLEKIPERSREDSTSSHSRSHSSRSFADIMGYPNDNRVSDALSAARNVRQDTIGSNTSISSYGSFKQESIQHATRLVRQSFNDLSKSNGSYGEAEKTEVPPNPFADRIRNIMQEAEGGTKSPMTTAL